jgi:hypothetical protein
MADPIQVVKTEVAAVKAEVAQVATFAAPVEAKVVAADNKAVAWVKANPAKAVLVVVGLVLVVLWKVL